MLRTGLRRRVEGLTKPIEELEATELLAEAKRAGCRPVATCREREEVTVTGVVRAVTLRPRKHVPLLVVELFDGTDVVRLVWLGRRSIRGVEAGAHLRATGVLARCDGVLTIHNPAYELIPTRGD